MRKAFFSQDQEYLLELRIRSNSQAQKVQMEQEKSDHGEQVASESAKSLVAEESLVADVRYHRNFIKS